MLAFPNTGSSSFLYNLKKAISSKKRDINCEENTHNILISLYSVDVVLVKAYAQYVIFGSCQKLWDAYEIQFQTMPLIP
jgi:hypothetical protein